MKLRLFSEEEENHPAVEEDKKDEVERCLYFGCRRPGRRDARLGAWDPILKSLTFCPEHLSEALERLEGDNK